MQLKRESKLARFYCWTYRDLLPDNFCLYFWKLLFALILFPITWASYPFDCHYWYVRFWSGLGVYVVLAGAAYYVFLWLTTPFQTALVTGTVVSTVVTGLLIIAAGYWLLDVWDAREKQTIFGEIADVVREQKNAVKDNYCPHIEWE